MTYHALFAISAVLGGSAVVSVVGIAARMYLQGRRAAGFERLARYELAVESGADAPESRGIGGLEKYWHDPTNPERDRELDIYKQVLCGLEARGLPPVKPVGFL